MWMFGKTRCILTVNYSFIRSVCTYVLLEGALTIIWSFIGRPRMFFFPSEETQFAAVEPHFCLCSQQQITIKSRTGRSETIRSRRTLTLRALEYESHGRHRKGEMPTTFGAHKQNTEHTCCDAMERLRTACTYTQNAE